MNYRKEIDGLRALAVLPVILCHAGFTAISGGFIGVDVFFVISGYLITSIIYNDLQKDRFTLASFYEKRARRILPALFAMSLTTIAVGYLLLYPSDFKDLSQSLFATSLFVSNIYFYLTSSYFSPSAEELPLLHTWSLAVEEQYYIFFPILMVWLYKKEVIKNQLLIILSVLLFSSFIAALYISAIDSSANFYLIISRVWELLAGALLGLTYKSIQNVKPIVKEVLSWLGIVLLFICYAIFSNKWPHPSWPTVVPVLATLLIIGFSQNTRVGNLLSHKIPVYIGAISYSLYLWHQPVFAFVRIKTVNTEFSLALITVLLGIIFLLSHLCYKFVETPFRDKTYLSRVKIFKLSITCIFAFTLIGLTGHVTNGVEERFIQTVDFNSVRGSPVRYQCHTSGAGYLKPDKACTSNGQPHTVVFGDSHGVELSYALSESFKEDNRSLLELTFSGCPPVYKLDTIVKGCKDWFREAIDYINNTQSIETVVLVFRHALYLNGYHLDAIKNGKTVIEPSVHIRNNLTAAQVTESYYHSMAGLVELFIEHGKKVIIVGPIPELKVHIKKMITPFSIFSDALTNDSYTTELSFQNHRSANIKNVLNQLASGKKGVTFLDSFLPFCSNEKCNVVIDNKAMYFDDNHLSVSGANAYVRHFKEEFNLTNIQNR